jgi:hypothetical protein
MSVLGTVVSLLIVASALFYFLWMGFGEKRGAEAPKATLEQARDIKDRHDLEALRRAIAAYRAQHDRNPESLDALKPLVQGDIAWERYNYDSVTGVVRLKP